MKDQESQGISDKKEKKVKTKEEKKQTRGHMAFRNNLWELRMDLWPILSKLEIWVLDLIIDRTIKWRQKETKISVGEIMTATGQDHTKIYRVLKSLETQKIIVRKKHNHDLYISLNEDYFGGLLIKRHEDALLLRKSKIKMIVDNSKNMCQISTGVVPNQHKVSAKSAQELCQISTKTGTQDLEIIEEKPPLKTLLKDISIKTFLKDRAAGTGESFTLSGGKGRTKEEQEKIVMEQLAQMKAGVLEA